MTGISEYSIIKDGGFIIEVGESITLQFNLVDDTDKKAKSVLFYICNPTHDVVNLRYKVWINGKSADRGAIAKMESAARSIHEVINPNILKPGVNEIKFEVLKGTGNITFSDVVLLYKRKE